MRSLFVFLGLLVFISCKRDKEKIPEEILQPEKMREVLWDMIRVDLFLRDSLFSDSVRLRKNTSFYATVMDLHKTTQDQFKKSFSYYREHPDMLKTILDSLEKRARHTEVIQPGKQNFDTLRKFRGFKKDE